MSKLPQKQITVELFGEQLPLFLAAGFLAQAAFITGHKILEDDKFFGELDQDGKPKMETRPGETFRWMLLLYAALLHTGRGITLDQILREVPLSRMDEIAQSVALVVARDLFAVGLPDEVQEVTPGPDPTGATSGSPTGQSDATASD